jgi:hypothetical protein
LDKEVNTMLTRFANKGWRAGVFALAVTLSLGACDLDKVLQVNDPEAIPTSILDDPTALDQIVIGAIRDFQIAYGGAGGDAYLSTSMAITDMFEAMGTFTTRNATDQRAQQVIEVGNTSDGAYINFHQARRALEIAYEKLVAVEDPRAGDIKAIEGYVYLALAEGYCGELAFSTANDDGSFEFGEPLTVQEVLTKAATTFDVAIAAGSDLGVIGKARTLVNQGNYADAALEAAKIEDDWTYFMEYSSTSTTPNNPLQGLMFNGRWGLAHEEGINGIGYRGTPDAEAKWGYLQDPRVPWAIFRNGFQSSRGPVYNMKYFNQGDDIILADGIEARLIEAEAALAADDVPGMLAILNELRANVGTFMPVRVADYDVFEFRNGVEFRELLDLTDPGTEEGRVRLLMEERAFWLLGTAHRLGDMRRMVRDYGLDAESVFPTGEFRFDDEPYGTDITMPLDFLEGNNPNVTLDACVFNDDGST